MKYSCFLVGLSMVLSGCVYSHTWHRQYSEYLFQHDGVFRHYRLFDKEDTWRIETDVNLEYERHLFTDKAGFGYYCMNPIEGLLQLPCALLTELPFRWMWEKRYVYQVPVRYDKSLKIKNVRSGGNWEKLIWEDNQHPGITNIVCATVKTLDEDTGMSEISVAHFKGGVKIGEVTLEPIVSQTYHHLQTFDGRRVYIWNEFDRASYLYGYFRCGPAARTSWCPLLQELDLETGIVKRLVWTEYNKLHHSDEVVVERRK